MNDLLVTNIHPSLSVWLQLHVLSTHFVTLELKQTKILRISFYFFLIPRSLLLIPQPKTETVVMRLLRIL